MTQHKFKGMFVRGDEIQAIFEGGYGFRSSDFGTTWYPMSGVPSSAEDIGFDIADERNSVIGADGILYTFSGASGEVFTYKQGVSISGVVTQIDVDMDSAVAVVGTDQKLYKTISWGNSVMELLDEPVTDVALGGNYLAEVRTPSISGLLLLTEADYAYSGLVASPTGDLWYRVHLKDATYIQRMVFGSGYAFFNMENVPIGALNGVAEVRLKSWIGATGGAISEWVTCPDAPFGYSWNRVVTFFSTIDDNNDVYLGGEDANFYKYNLISGTYTKKANKYSFYPGHCAFVTRGNKIYWGQSNHIRIYNKTTDAWESVSSAAPYGQQVEAICFEDSNTIWAVCTGVGGVSKVLKYTISTDTWTEYSNSTGSTARGRAAYFDVANGKVWFSSAVQSKYWSYEIATDTYTQHTATGLNGGYFLFNDATQDGRFWCCEVWDYPSQGPFGVWNVITGTPYNEVIPYNSQGNDLRSGGEVRRQRTIGAKGGQTVIVHSHDWTPKPVFRKCTGGDLAEAQQFLKSGGSQYSTPRLEFSDTETYLLGACCLDPYTSEPWTISGVNALIAGIDLQAPAVGDVASGVCRCDQIFLEVYDRGKNIGVVGSAPVDRYTAISCANTLINKAYPATKGGKLNYVDVYVKYDMTDVKIATFYSAGGSTYSTRAYVVVGSLSAGYHRITANIDIQIGDFIGVYASTGTIAADYGFVSNEQAVKASGDKIPCTGETFTAVDATYKYIPSIRGVIF